MTRRHLNTRERFALQTLVKEEFELQSMNDVEFAKYAEEKLGIPGCNDNHIMAARKDFDIPAFKDRARTPRSVESRLDHLEGDMHKVLNYLVGKFGYPEA